MNSKFYKLFSLLAGLLTLFAVIGVSTASYTYFYQPKVPKCLTKK